MYGTLNVYISQYHSVAMNVNIQVINKILGLCGDSAGSESKISPQHESVQRQFRATFSSCLCREVLKLGKGRIDKLVMKDLVKCLTSIPPESWMTAAMVSAPYRCSMTVVTTRLNATSLIILQKDEVVEVLGAVNKCVITLDKTTLNSFDKYTKSVEREAAAAAAALGGNDRSSKQSKTGSQETQE